MDGAGGIASALSAVANAVELLPAPGMIIGGIAVILQGVPRVTRDVDATVDASTGTLEDVAKHFEAHGITTRIADALELARTSQVLLLRLIADIATPEDLVIYKAVAWRPQDQQDVERLLTLHAQRIDLSRVRRIVGELAEALDESERVAQLNDVIRRAIG